MLIGDGGPDLLSTDGKTWTIRFGTDDPSGSNGVNTVEGVHDLVSPTHPDKVAAAGKQYAGAGETLTYHAGKLQGHADTLAGVWSGAVAEQRQQWITQLSQTASELGDKSSKVGAALTAYAPALLDAKRGIDQLLTEKNQLRGQLNGVTNQLGQWDNVLTQVAGGLLPPLGAIDVMKISSLRSQASGLQNRMHELDKHAVDLLNTLTGHATDAFYGLPSDVTKNLPSK